MYQRPPLIKPSQALPPATEFNDDGMVAISLLTPERGIEGYSKGIFPFCKASNYFPFSFKREDDYYVWHSSDPRAVLYPNKFNFSRSLKKSIKKLSVRYDTCFEHVLLNCAKILRKGQDIKSQYWLDEEGFIEFYRNMSELGHAHSVETFEGEELVGGLIGIAIGSVFFGDSQFHKVRDASKVALFHLVEMYKTLDSGIIDCQVATSHMFRMGAEEIHLEEFIKQISESIKKDNPWHSL